MSLTYARSLSVLHDGQYPDSYQSRVSDVLHYLADGDQLKEVCRAVDEILDSVV